MAKKFKNLDEDSGKDTVSLLIDSANKPTSAIVETAVKKDSEIVKTYQFKESDLEFLGNYARKMAYENKEDYPIKRAIADAINLLRKKHPNVQD